MEEGGSEEEGQGPKAEGKAKEGSALGGRTNCRFRAAVKCAARVSPKSDFLDRVDALACAIGGRRDQLEGVLRRRAVCL